MLIIVHYHLMLLDIVSYVGYQCLLHILARLVVDLVAKLVVELVFASLVK